MRDEAAKTPDGDATVETSASSEQPPLPSTPNADSPSSKTPSPRGWLSSVRRPKTSPAPKASALKRTLLTEDDARRDSALASSNSTASTEHNTTNGPSTPTSLHKAPSLPAIVVQDEPSVPSGNTSQQVQAEEEQQVVTAEPFHGIDTIIPTGDFDDLTSPSQVSFSKRGSMLLGGKRANRMNKQLGLVKEGDAAAQSSSHQNEQEQEKPNAQKEKALSPPATPRRVPRTPSRFSSRGRILSNRVLSADEMMLSRKVRSMYQHGDESAADWEGVQEEAESVNNSFADNSSYTGTPANNSSLTVDRRQGDSSSILSSTRGSGAMIAKEPNETAGGIEDWSELEGVEVDRYGFIMPKKTNSQGSSTGGGLDGPDEPRIQRVATGLKLVAEEPRRRGIGRSVSKARSSRSANPNSGSPKRRRSQKSSKPPASIFSNRTSRSSPQKPLRQAANRLPHNRNRRLLDEASDMLKLPPGLAEVAEQQEGGKAAQTMKAKEIEREEKWRKMAKVVQSGAKSGGMMFEFDVKDPKVVSRTWKGIPDRWRATAWYTFLAASAKGCQDAPTDEELVESFYELQEESSADDMQIDVDVPRTINRHIMFRRRYRGG